MLERLAKLNDKYSDISASLEDPAVISDIETYTKLLKEYKNLTPIIEEYRRYLAAVESESESRSILDDSSSALDYKTDANLRKALDENMSGATVITVAQRVSSVKDSDLIIVLDDGNIIGMGKHEELLAQNGMYAKLYKSQFAH